MSDKFKFTSKERNIIYEEAHLFREDELSFQTMFDRIESIIQDRGNSIQDGWIDRKDRTPNLTNTDAEINILAWDDVFCKVVKIDILDFMQMPKRFNKWQPLPSAPKQPKK